MKNIIINAFKRRLLGAILLCSTILISTSCNDVLNIGPDGRLSMVEIFDDPNMVAAYLNSCYSGLPAKGYRYYQHTNFFDAVSDNGWDCETETLLPVPTIYFVEASAGDHPFDKHYSEEISDRGPRNSKFWDVHWSGIRKCGVFLKYIADANVSDVSTKQRWKAEAHILRAYYYLELIKLYGGNLPIEKEPYDFDSDFSTLKQESFYDIVKFIIEDCDEALKADALPWRINSPAEEVRVTKAVAEAIKSRAILYAASPLFNDGQNHWEEAYQITKKSVDNLKAKGYKLYSELIVPDEYLDAFDGNEYAALFNEYHTKAMQYQSGEADMETIWQGSPNLANVPIFVYQGIGFQFGDRTGICPSQELADAFETTNGETILNLKQPYLDEKHLEPNYNSNPLYNPEDPYKDRDPRFYATIYHHLSHRECYWGVQDQNGNIPPSYRKRLITTNVEDQSTGRDPSSKTRTRTGYYHRKSLHPTSGTDSPHDVQVGPPVKLFRFAELLLNYAEAAAEANHLTEARNAVNEVRARVNMPKLSESLSQEDLILRIRNERRVELAYEEHRYFDVRRVLNPTDDLSKTDKWITAMDIRIDASKPTGYSYSRISIGSNPRVCWKNKNLLMPIPQVEAARLENITGKEWQRPNW